MSKEFAVMVLEQMLVDEDLNLRGNEPQAVRIAIEALKTVIKAEVR